MTPIEQLKTWYGDFLPSSIDSSFFNFIANSREFATQITGKTIDVIIDPKSHTAYTDLKKIYLPAIFFLEQTYEMLGLKEEDYVASAALVNNLFQIHEALHILLSQDPKETIKLHLKAVKLFDKYGKNFFHVLNITEDFYIEDYCRRHFPSFSFFVDGGDSILLAPHLLEKNYSEFLSSDNKFESAIVLINYFKNHSLFNHFALSEFFRIANILNKLKNDMLPISRLLAAIDIFEILLEMFPQDAAKSKEKTKQQNIDNEQFDKDLNVLGETLQEISKDSKTPQKLQKISKALTEIFKESNKDKNKEKFEIQVKTKDELNSVDGLKKIKVLDAMLIDAKISNSIIPDNSWQKLGRYLRYARQTKTFPGTPIDKGGHFVKSRIHRIATDNKILGIPKPKLTRGIPEVIILVDSSGSMSQSIGNGETLFEYAVKSSYGMFNALSQSGINCAVYGHTTVKDSNDSAVLISSVAAFRMPFIKGDIRVTHGNVKTRFNKFAELYISENYDGYAIEYVGKQFSKDICTKVLIVLSDGSPNAENYRGGSAMEHTRKSVEALRKSNISVYSISLVEGVIETNDRIYGASFNLTGYGKNLEKSLERLASFIAQF